MSTHILLVEDNSNLLDTLSLELELRGYRVSSAENGTQALQVLRQTNLPVDVIISDINMPDMNGFQLIEIIQQTPALRGIPFIFMTARNSQDDVMVSKQLGADDYLIKPISIDDIVVSVENKLRRVAVWKDIGQKNTINTRQALNAIIESKKDHIHMLLEAYGISGLLLEDLEAMPDEFSQQALSALQQTSQQVSRLINQIVILTKISTGEIRPFAQNQLVPLDFDTILTNVIELLSAEFDDCDRVNFTPQTSKKAKVYGVWDLTVTIVSEVVRNALLFSDAEVSIHIDTVNRFGVIRVVDSGIGIPPEYNDYIWDRFYQLTVTGRPQQGAGLGLPIVYEGLQLLSGRIRVDTLPSGGTVFAIYLPLVQ